jgi:hypothetical protein
LLPSRSTSASSNAAGGCARIPRAATRTAAAHTNARPLRHIRTVMFSLKRDAGTQLLRFVTLGSIVATMSDVPPRNTARVPRHLVVSLSGRPGSPVGVGSSCVHRPPRQMTGSRKSSGTGATVEFTRGNVTLSAQASGAPWLAGRGPSAAGRPQ